MEVLGLKPGPQIGELLEEAFVMQLGHELESREAALDWLKEQTVSM